MPNYNLIFRDTANIITPNNKDKIPSKRGSSKVRFYELTLPRENAKDTDIAKFAKIRQEMVNAFNLKFGVTSNLELVDDRLKNLTFQISPDSVLYSMCENVDGVSTPKEDTIFSAAARGLLNSYNAIPTVAEIVCQHTGLFLNIYDPNTDTVYLTTAEIEADAYKVKVPYASKEGKQLIEELARDVK